MTQEHRVLIAEPIDPRAEAWLGRHCEIARPSGSGNEELIRALAGCDGTDEDVLTYAMFPQVAPKFFAHRAEGPKNVGKTPGEPAKAAPAAKPADGRVPVAVPVTYEVRIGDRSHKVTVVPA